MKTSILLSAVLVATIALIKVQPTAATFQFSWNYFYWKKVCFSKKADKPDYEEKRPDNQKFKGSVCSEGGVCDVLPCGLDGFENDCPCQFEEDTEGYPYNCNHDFDDDPDGTQTGSHSSTGSSGTSSGSTGSISGDSTETSTETEDSDSSQHGSRRKRTSYDGSYVDKAGFRVYYQWQNSKRYYWFWNKDNEKKRFYERDNRRCYYYYKDSVKYEYYNGDDGKRHYYDKDGNTHTQSDTNSDSSSHSNSHSGSHSNSHSGSHSNSHSNSRSSGGKNRDGCDSGGIGGPKGHRKVCFAFKDAYCIKHGFSIGYRQECLRGQDRCIIEIDDDGLYNRRCGAQSECDALGLTQENCTHAGCKLFDCIATGCTYTLDRKNFFSFTREGRKCGCDAWCWETYIGRDDCCPDACSLCTEGATNNTHCSQLIENPTTAFNFRK